MTVGRICTREVDTARVAEPVVVAARRMRERRVGSLVVVDDEGRAVGIVTDRDLVERVLATDRNPHTVRLGDVMTLRPKVVTEDLSLTDAVGLMRDGRFRRLPVCDAQGRLNGLVSLDDVMLEAARELRAVGTLLELESPRHVAVG